MRSTGIAGAQTSPLSIAKIISIHYLFHVILERFPNIQQLSPSDKLLLASELWNELEANPADIPVSPEIIAELDRRIQHFETHPEEFTTWESVKQRLLQSKA
jgi:putative addiction module component (TIGR02574 family)